MRESKLFYTYKNMVLPARASVWFIMMSVMQKGIQFLVTPIYTRLLTTEEYGYYSIFVTWQSILMIIATLNLGAGAFYNGMLKYEEDRPAFITAMQGLGNVCTLAVFSILFIFYKFTVWITGLDLVVLVGMFVSFLLYPAFDYWAQHNRYAFHYRPLIVWTVLFAVVSSGVSIVLIVVLSDKKNGIVFGTILTQIVWGLIFYIRNLKVGKVLFQKDYWSFAFKFNIALIPHYLAFIILGQSDRVMIQYYSGTSAVGIYSLSYTVALMFSIIVNALSGTFAPWTYQRMKEKDTDSLKKYSNMVLLMLSGIVVVCVLIAPELVRFLGTDEYFQAVWIIPPVVLSCFFTMIYSLFANIEFYFEKNIYVMIASVLAAVSNIILNIIFIPLYGYLAAGYTTLVCYIFLAMIHYTFMNRILKIEGLCEVYDIKAIVGLSLGISGISILLILTYQKVLIRYLILVSLSMILVMMRRRIYMMIKLIRVER